MIENKRYKISKSDIGDAGSLPTQIAKLAGKKPLRWYVAQVSQDEVEIEATTYQGELSGHDGAGTRLIYPGKSVVLSVIPTGVGCSIGGYAGDAAPVTNLLASTVDYLVTNPNAVNASNFISLDRNVLYTEGSCIDLFMQGLVDLRVPYSNRVGLIVERTDNDSLDVIFNIVNTVRAVHGINVVDFAITEEPIAGRCVMAKSGAFGGVIDNPDTLFKACEKLLSRGVNAIAITSRIKDLPERIYEGHFNGEYPNPTGGAEAVISFLVTNRYKVPAAHAPLINIDLPGLKRNVVDPRGAGEKASKSGLACVLIGLQRAPQISPESNSRISDVININNLLAVVTPAGCLGGVPQIYAQGYGIPIIAVRENQTILDVTRAKIGLRDVIEVGSYAEAAGVIMALKRGINLESVSRPLNTLSY